MKVTTRDLFNFVNPARTYVGFLGKTPDGDLYTQSVFYAQVLEAKQQGTLAGEQVQHERANDEVDCGD